MSDNLTCAALIKLAHELAPVTIRTTEALTEQYRFPRTKKRRIRNKWSKRPQNLRALRGGIFHEDSKTLYVHPDIKTLIEASL